MAKTNITGHGQDYCGTKHCKGDLCGGAGNKIKTNSPLDYTSITEATQEVTEPKEIQSKPLTFDDISNQLDESIKTQDKKNIKQLLFDYPGVGTFKVVTSGIFSSKEIDKLRQEGLIRLADMMRSPNFDPKVYSTLNDLIKDEALGDKKMETFIRKECMKAIRANPNTPKKVIVDDLTENIPKLNQLMRDLEELKQHPLIAGQPNPTIEVIESQANKVSEAIAEGVKHPSLSGEDIAKIYKFGKTEEFYDAILENPNCSEGWINAIPDNRPVIVEKYLKNPKLNQDNINKYSKSTNPKFRLAIARNPSANEEVVRELCNDLNKDVAQEAKAHKNAPIELLGSQIDVLKQKRQSLIHDFDRFVNNPSKDVRFEQDTIISFQNKIENVDKAISERKSRLQLSAKDSATKSLDDLLN